MYKRTDNEVKNYWNTRLKKRVAKDCLPQADEPSRNSPNVSVTSTDSCGMIDERSIHQIPSDTSSSSSSSSARVLNLIASNVHLVNLGRVISDSEVGSPNKHSHSSNAVSSSEALQDETTCIESMESQSSIEKLFTESTTDFDDPFSTGFDQLSMDGFYGIYSEYNL